MDYRKLETLSNLKRAGEISEEEFQFEKAKLRNERGSPFKRGNNLNLEEYYFLMLLHLTLFCGFIIPLIGSAVPLVLWLQNKDHNPKVDIHGRIVFNWIFSSAFYALCGVVLSGIGLGLVILGVLIILGIIFPMVAAFKARKDKFWPYPLSIDFMGVNERVQVFRQMGGGLNS